MEYLIADHYASAIVNADYSAIDEHDSEAMDRFFAMDANIVMKDSETQWARCEISGLMAMCHEYVSI